MAREKERERERGGGAVKDAVNAKGLTKPNLSG